MNLFDCRIPYVVVSKNVTELSNKTALSAALRMYREGGTASLLGELTSRYRARKAADVRWELQQRGLISDNLELTPVAIEDRVTLPATFDYSALSFGPLKALIACYWRTRYSQESFRFTCTQDQLAKDARLSPQSLRDALTRLQNGNFIQTEKIWKEGSRITLLEPQSACPLFYIGEFYRDQLDGIPVHDRYKVCLGHYDARGHLPNIREPVSNYQVVCPFCTAPDPKGSLRINTSPEADFWFCHKCKRKGDSARLWAKLQWRIGRDSWKAVLARTGATAVEEHERVN